MDKIYLDPSNPGAFRTAKDLYISAKSAGLPHITLNRIKQYLQGKPGYTMHHWVLKKFKQEKIISYGFLDLVQVIISFFFADFLWINLLSFLV
ncbi:hypothetical protein [Oceanimonas doudoroffii]|uniref:hypothetical protein n=1 Tax=Oceanimonas doudoroffii TaxID=84158 RepID=UPI00113FC56C|nr:hypothetical protein [Oceanimonas doudoroffii]